jgi:hypothetical protein
LEGDGDIGKIGEMIDKDVFPINERTFIKVLSQIDFL